MNSLAHFTLSYPIVWRLGSKIQGFCPIRQAFLDPARRWDTGSSWLDQLLEIKTRSAGTLVS